MSGHTPGPWRTGHGNFTSIIAQPSPADPKKVVAMTAEMGMEDGEELANARLIAAAPDLLEALRACEENLRLIHGGAGPVAKDAPMPAHSTFQAWRLASEAIAKADGSDS